MTDEQKQLQIQDDRNAQEYNITEFDYETIRATIGRNLKNPQQMNLFLFRCRELGVKPLSGQIVPFPDKETGGVHFITTRDYFRERGMKSNICDGYTVEPIYDESDRLVAAKATIYRKDCSHPFEFIARWSEFGSEKFLWKKMPALMLCKCAEVGAWRMAFPDYFNGLYLDEEFDRQTPATQEDPAIVELRGDIRREAAKLMTNAELNKLASQTIGAQIDTCRDKEKLQTLFEAVLSKIPQPETK